MDIDFDKDKIGCVENCNETCTPYSFDVIKEYLQADNRDIRNNNLGDKISQAFRKVPFSDKNVLFDETILNENSEASYASLEDVLADWIVNKSRYQTYNKNSSDEKWKKGMKKLWRLFIDHVKKHNPSAFRKDIKLSSKTVLDNENPVLNNQNNIDRLIASGFETPELKKWRNFDVFNDGSKKGSRLMLGNKECEKLDETFPCFVNWMGRKDISGNMPGAKGYDPSKPLGHNDGCYDETWKDYTAPQITGLNNKYFSDKINDFEMTCIDYSDPGAVGLENSQKFRGQMSKIYEFEDGTRGTLLEHTITPWSKISVPNVRNNIKEMRKVADEGNQYVSIFDIKEEYGYSKRQQIMGSSKIMAEACYNELPRLKDNTSNATGSIEGVKSDYNTMPFSCDDRFIKDNPNVDTLKDSLRPKECTNHFWKKNTDIYSSEDNVIRPKTTLDSSYNQMDDKTWDNVWGMSNLPYTDFADKVHYKEGFTNAQLNKNLHEMSIYVKNFRRDKQNPTFEEYDKYLYYNKLLYGSVNDNDMIWKDLGEKEVKVDSEQKVSGPSQGVYKPWVKMCWGDFKTAMKLTHGDKVKILPNKNLKILDGNLDDVITGNKNLTLKKILGEETNYEFGLPNIINERMYKGKWFPFWRFFKGEGNEKYYELTKYNLNEEEQRKNREKIDSEMERTYATYYLYDNVGDYTSGMAGSLKTENT